MALLLSLFYAFRSITYAECMRFVGPRTETSVRYPREKKTKQYIRDTSQTRKDPRMSTWLYLGNQRTPVNTYIM